MHLLLDTTLLTINDFYDCLVGRVSALEDCISEDEQIAKGKATGRSPDLPAPLCENLRRLVAASEAERVLRLHELRATAILTAVGLYDLFKVPLARLAISPSATIQTIAAGTYTLLLPPGNAMDSDILHALEECIVSRNTQRCYILDCSTIEHMSDVFVGNIAYLKERLVRNSGDLCLFWLRENAVTTPQRTSLVRLFRLVQVAEALFSTDGSR